MAESVRISPKFAARAAAVAALTMLSVVAPVLAFGGPVPPAGATGGGGSFFCSGIDGITQQEIGYTVTMDAGTSGSAFLGGTYISNCELTGTVPSGWTVLQETSASLDNDSENDGNWTIDTDDQSITGAGTFTNTGTITDESDGFTQQVDVPDFVNTGTVASVEGEGNTESPGFIITGTGNVFENQGLVTSETGGSISFEYATFKLESGGSVAASPGLIGLAEDSILDVEGGSVTSGVITTTTLLGTTASEVEFGSSVPAGSTGTVDLASSVTLSGTVPSGWTVNITGGSPTVTPGSGNDGAIVWDDGNSTFADSGTFTNAGTFTDESSSNTQDIAVVDFVNTGTVTSDSEGFELCGGSSSDLFDNQGAVTVGTGGVVSVDTGTFESDSGGTIAAAGGTFALANHSTFEVAGGSVTSGDVGTVVTLGVGPSNLTFAPSVPSGSTGTVELTSSITLNGTIASGWTVDSNSGSTLTAAPGSGNDGTLAFGSGGNNSFDGTGSFTNDGTMTVGGGADLDVDIAAFTNGSSGTVSNQAGTYLAFANGAPPTNLSGGVLTGGTWSAGAQINFDAPFTTDDATMALTTSTGVFATGDYLSFVDDAINTLTTIDNGAFLTLGGGSSETVDGSLVNDGTLTLASSDKLTVDNGLTEGSGATLATTLAGTGTGTYGHVAVADGAALGGTLQLATTGGYTPSPGDTQAVVTGSPVTGTFSSVTGQTTWPEGVSAVNYSTNAADVFLLSISLTKSSLTSGYGRAGDTIDYQYVITNDTQSTLTGLAVSDSLIATGDISCPSSTLAAGASETCTASYTASQADVDGGSVTNTAQVTGTYPGSVTLSSPTSSVTVPASEATSSLSLVKSTSTSGYGAAGDTIDYSYAITNTGTTTLSNVGVDDNYIPGDDISCPSSTLSPSADETCTASYSVSQADVDAGSVTNTAQATATNPHGTVIDSASSSVTVEANEATATISLSESTPAANYTAAGQQVEFDYTVTNTGTITLDNACGERHPERGLRPVV